MPLLSYILYTHLPRGRGLSQNTEQVLKIISKFTYLRPNVCIITNDLTLLDHVTSQTPDSIVYGGAYPLSLHQIYLGAGFNFVGSVLRWVSTVHPIVCSSVYDKSGFLVAMVGQFLTACAQPFLLYAPTKLAAVWFGPNQRAICTNFASIGKSVLMDTAHATQTLSMII